MDNDRYAVLRTSPDAIARLETPPLVLARRRLRELAAADPQASFGLVSVPPGPTIDDARRRRLGDLRARLRRSDDWDARIAAAIVADCVQTLIDAFDPASAVDAMLDVADARLG